MLRKSVQARMDFIEYSLSRFSVFVGSSSLACWLVRNDRVTAVTVKKSDVR